MMIFVMWTCYQSELLGKVILVGACHYVHRIAPPPNDHTNSLTVSVIVLG